MIDKSSSKIQWQVATPIVNASYFDVEYSYDSKEWKKLNAVAITNINNGHYEMIHNDLNSNILFYRIKEMDNDGVYYYSKVVVLRNNQVANDYGVYPNPVKNILRIVSPKETVNNTSATLLDLSGRAVMKFVLKSIVEEVNLNDVPNGRYLLLITDEQNTITKKIIVKH